MTLLFYFLYNLLLLVAFPFVWISAYFNDKLGNSLSGQHKIQSALKAFRTKVDLNPKPVIWLHAASAGEFEQIKPVLSRLHEMNVYVFQTFTSATIYYKASQDSRFDGVSFLPWDLYPRVNRFIKILKPDLHINTRHDVWPNLLLSLHRNHIRNVLINANLYKESKRLTPAFKVINRIIFKYIDHIYTGSESLKAHLIQLYSGPIHVVGDSRFDQVNERAKINNSALISYNIIADRRVIIYGSVVDSDLEVVTSAIAKSLLDKDYLHVLVPHEVLERDLIPWEIALYRDQIKSIRLSEISQYNNESVLIWNSVGQLADLYQHATLAFIGAGFSTGVHSVTEAVMYHVPSAHGPKYDILAEAIDLVDQGLSTVVYDSNDLSAFILTPPDIVQKLSKSIAAFVSARIGATDRIMTQEFPLH